MGRRVAGAPSPRPSPPTRGRGGRRVCLPDPGRCPGLSDLAPGGPGPVGREESGLPLWKRGIEGDSRDGNKSPLAPLLRRGGPDPRSTRVRRGFALTFLTLLLLAFATPATAQITCLYNLAAWQASFDANETLTTNASGVGQATEVAGSPSENQSLGASLTFASANTGLSWSFRADTLETNAQWVFDDDEFLHDSDFDNALSVGDIDNQTDDDFTITITGGSSLFGIGFRLQDTNSQSGEMLTVLGTDASTLGTCTNIPSGDSVFVGVVSPNAEIGSVTYDENSGGDDIAVRNFYFGRLDNDLGITKDNGTTSLTPGQTTTYSIVVSNNSSSDASGITVDDAFPTQLTGCTWTCAGTGGSTCTGSGSGNVADTANVTGGGTVTYSVTCTVDAAATGSVANTASITIPDGVLDTDSTNNSATDTDTIIASTDLSVTKDDGVTEVDVGANLTYTLTVTNAGPSDSTGGTVSDPLPAGTTFVSSASGCSDGGGTVSCSFGALPSGMSTDLMFTVQVDASAASPLMNTATVMGNEADANAGNDSGSHSTPVIAQADLALSKLDSPDPVVAGELVTYTLQVSNNGPSDAPGATISDTLPNGLTFDASADCSDAGSSVSCTLGAIPAGGMASVSFTARVDEDQQPGNVTNTATVTIDAGSTMAEDPVSGNNTASAVTEVIRQADLTMAKADGGLASVVAGTAIQYTLTVGNLGPNDVTSAVVSDTFSGDLDDVSWTCIPTPGAFCDLVGSGSINDAVTIPEGGQLVYTVNATVESGATGTLFNSALVTPPSNTEDPDLTNNQDTTNTPIIRETDLELTKDDGGVDSVVAGGNLNYLVTVRNLGPSDSGGSSFVDTLPTGTGFVTSPSGCTAAGGIVTCDVGALRAGTQRILVFAVEVDPGQTLDLLNSATVTADDPDPNGANDTGTHTTPVEESTNLTLLKEASVSTVAPGDTFTYFFTVENLGPSDSSGATLEDPLPPGLTFVGGGGCSDVGGTVECAVPALTVGDTTTFGFDVTVDTGVETTILNTATVVANEADPALVDNTSSHSLGVAAEADLALTKDDGVASAAPGEQLTITLSLFNNGPSDAGPGSLEDPLPSGMTFVSSSDGCAGLGTSSTVVCPYPGLAAGLGLTRTFVVAIDPAAIGSLVNTANIVADQPDPVAANDTASHTTPLVPRVDLALAKDDGGVSAVPGQTLDYTLTIENLGPSDSTGGSVGDFLPAGLSFASSADGCTAAGSNVTCPFGALPAGDSVTRTFTVLVAPTVTTAITNTATVSGTEPDPAAANNTAMVTTPLAALADLALSKDDGVAQAVAGTDLTYTLTVDNLGPSDSTGATISDPLPAGTSFVSSVSGCVEGAGTVVCPVGPLSQGASAAVSFVVAIDPAQTETLTNIATVVGNEPDPENTNDGASHETPIVAEADLSLTKDDFVASAAPGEEVPWTLSVSNLGPSRSAGATATDVLPPSLIFVSSADGCTHDGAIAGGTVTCPVGSIDPAATATATFVTRIDPAATGSVLNSATVVGDDTDPVAGNDTGSHTLPLSPSADLEVVKTDAQTVVAPGESLTYTVTVRNLGPSDAPSATVTDTFPSELTSPTWTCLPSAGASCTASGSGSLSDAVTLPAGAALVYTVLTQVAADASGLVSNTATVSSAVADPALANNTSTDTDTLAATADLAISKSDGTTVAVPGETVTYTLAVSNLGPSDVPDALLTDVFPPEVASVAWTCVASAGSTCSAAAGSGDLAELVLIRAGGTVTYTAVATIDAGASGLLTNTATVAVPAGVTDPVSSNDSATDSDTLTPRADLRISKSDGSETATPGAPLTYTLVVSNAGPGDAVGAQVIDLFPPELSGIAWTCVPDPGATCTAAGTGNLLDSVSLPAGTAVTYTATATLDAEADATLTNTATVTAPPGIEDPAPANNSATDSDTVAPVADLGISKGDGLATVVPGTALTYTLVVANAGPSAVHDAQVADSVPVGLSCVWTCSPSVGADCLVGQATGDLVDLADLPVGGSVVYTGQCDVAANAVDLLGSTTLANTATVAPPTGTSDPSPGNDSASDLTTLVPTADLAITKSDGRTSVVPGADTLTYTVGVSNTGPSDVRAATVTDVLPPGLDCVWSCTPGDSASCPAGQSTGNLSIGVDLDAGASLTLSAVCVVTSDAAQLNLGGSLSNTASVAPPSGVTDPDPNDDQASDLDTVLLATVDLRTSKTADRAVAVPGDSLGYTVRFENVGPSDAFAVAVSDPIPAELVGVSWTCAADPGATCTAVGSGDVADVVDLPASTGVTYSISAMLPADTPAGSLSNTASLVVPAMLVDAVPGNETATVVLPIEPRVDLAVTKSDGLDAVVPGSALTYTLTVSNTGPSDAVGATVEDLLPPVLGGALWTCLPTPLSSCTLLGSGDVVDTVTLRAGGTLIYTVTATVDPDAVALLAALDPPASELANTVTVAAAGGTVDLDPSNDQATDVDLLTPEADLSLSKTDGLATVAPGEALVYTLVAANAGPSVARGVALDDPFPTDLDCEWTCAADPGASCSELGPTTGDVALLLDLGVGSQVTVTALCTVDAASAGALTNVAQLTLPFGTTDPTPADLVASDVTDLEPRADVVVRKDDGLNEAAPGDVLPYTITVANPFGPSDLTGVTVEDVFPDAVSCVWGCVGTFGATCTAGQVAGDLLDVVSLPVGSTATYTASCTVDGDASGPIVNGVTATVAAGSVDSNPSNNGDSDTTVIEPRVDLEITVDDGVDQAIPGESLTLVVVTRNPLGPTVGGARVVSDFPPSLDCLWTCVGSGGGGCSAGQTAGPIDDLVNLPAGASVTHTAVCSIDPTATGTLASRVRVELPVGTVDPDPQDNEALDADTLLIPTADVVITKGDGRTSVLAGETVTYTIEVANADGPSAVAGVLVEDVFPDGLDCVWTCDLTGAATCTAGPVAGDLIDPVDLPPGTAVTYAAVCQVGLGASGSLVNTATVTLPEGTHDPLPANNSATDDDTTIVPVVDLAITVDDRRTQATPGETLDYEIVVEHRSALIGAGPHLGGTRLVRITGSLSDPGLGPGSVEIQELGVLPFFDCDALTLEGSSAWLRCAEGLVLVDVGQIDALLGRRFEAVDIGEGHWLRSDGRPLRFPSDPGQASHPAGRLRFEIQGDELVRRPSDGSESTASRSIAGLDFELAALAFGPTAPLARGVQVVDVFPPELDCTWTCTGRDGGVCEAGPVTGSIVDATDLPAGASVTYDALCAIAPDATGLVSNTATLTPPADVVDSEPSNDSATDTTLLAVAADLQLNKTDGVVQATPGSTLTYTLVASNPGPSTVVGARLLDAFPAGLSCSTDCAGSGGAVCPPTPLVGDLDTAVDLPVGSSATFTASCVVDPTLLGTLENTAVLEAPPGVAELELNNNFASDLDTVLRPAADLAVSLDDGVDEAIPGTALGYQLVASNSGPSRIPDAVVSTLLPSTVACTWSCVGVGGGTCDPMPPAGDLATVVDLPPGGSALFTATCTVDPAATGTLVASATVTVPSSADELAPGDNTAIDADSLLVPTADLAITKDDGVDEVAPGGTTTYTLAVSNPAGPSQITGATVQDLFAPSLDCQWSCVPSSGAVCTLGPVAGDLVDAATLPPGALLTYTAVCQIDPTATGLLSNSASIAIPEGSVDPMPGNDTAADVDTLVPMADLVVDKTDGLAQTHPGLETTYTVTVSNPGPSPIVGALVSDVLPSELDCVWTCVPGIGASCDPGPSTGDLVDSVTLPPGIDVVYTGACTIDPGATGTLVNSASVQPPAGSVELDPSNNSDDDGTTLVPEGDLAITKDDGQDAATPGSTVTYTLTVVNEGPSDAPDVTVSDPFPPELDCSWSCSPTGGAVCEPGPVVGDLLDTPTIPALTSAVYTAVCAIDADATGLLTNVAFVDAPMGFDPDPSNDMDEDVDTLSQVADLAVTVADEPDPVAPGELLTYFVTVDNFGPLADPSVVVTGLLPAGVTLVDSSFDPGPGALFADGFESGSTSAWSSTQGAPPPPKATEGSGVCSDAGGTLTCPFGSLAGGASRTLAIVVQVDGDATGTLIHTVSVEGDGDDPDTANDTAVELTQVVGTFEE